MVKYKLWRELYGKQKEYRLENMTWGQGHYYHFDNIQQAKKQALKDAKRTGEVWVYQLWQPKRGKAFLAKPKAMKNMTTKQIITFYKKKGFDVRQFGGH